MYYVLDKKGNRVESFTKEEYMAIMQQAIENGTLAGIDAESAFVSKLKCCVGGGTFKTAFIKQAVYNQLRESGQLESNALYFITDDTTEQNLENKITALEIAVENISDGTTKINLKNSNDESKTLDMSTDILKIGDEIIARKKLIYNGEGDITGLEFNKTYEIEYTGDIIIGNSKKCVKLKFIPIDNSIISFYENFERVMMIEGIVNIYCTEFRLSKGLIEENVNNFSINNYLYNSVNGKMANAFSITINKIYEVIE